MNVLFTTVARTIATAAVSVVYMKGVEKLASDVEIALEKSKAKRAQLRAAREATELMLSEKREEVLSALIKAGLLHKREKTYRRDGNAYDATIYTSKPIGSADQHILLAKAIKAVHNDKDFDAMKFMNGFGFDVFYVDVVHRVVVGEHTERVGHHTFTIHSKQFRQDVENGVYDELVNRYASSVDNSDIIDA